MHRCPAYRDRGWHRAAANTQPADGPADDDRFHYAARPRRQQRDPAGAPDALRGARWSRPEERRCRTGRCSRRLRPILMSTMTSLFGMLPLLVIPGPGTEVYQGLAAVIVGGMAAKYSPDAGSFAKPAAGGRECQFIRQPGPLGGAAIRGLITMTRWTIEQSFWHAGADSSWRSMRLPRKECRQRPSSLTATRAAITAAGADASMCRAPSSAAMTRRLASELSAKLEWIAEVGTEVKEGDTVRPPRDMIRFRAETKWKRKSRVAPRSVPSVTPF